MPADQHDGPYSTHTILNFPEGQLGDDFDDIVSTLIDAAKATGTLHEGAMKIEIEVEWEKS